MNKLLIALSIILLTGCSTTKHESIDYTELGRTAADVYVVAEPHLSVEQRLAITTAYEMLGQLDGDAVITDQIFEMVMDALENIEPQERAVYRVLWARVASRINLPVDAPKMDRIAAFRAGLEAELTALGR